jgi:hypothetical protein
MGHYCSGTNDGSFPNGDIAHNHSSAADGCTLSNQSLPHLPVSFSLQPATSGSSTRHFVVDKNNTVPDENLVFNSDTFTHKSMTGNLTPGANRRTFLDFHKSANLTSSPTVQPYKLTKSAT